jgi:tetratricopeptide (TPR) repeat protein
MMTSANSGGSLIGKIGSYLQIVTKDPRSTAFVPLAEAYRQIGLLDDALEATRMGTGMLPHFSPGFSTMGRILGQMGRIDESMSAYAKALSIDRQSQAALVGLARLHLIRSERDQARKILTQAKEFHPGDEKISDMLTALDLPRPWAEIQQASHSQVAVSQDEAGLAKTGPEATGEPIPTATLAEIYVRQGLSAKAVKVYQEVLKLNPDNDAARERMMQLREPLTDEPGMSVGEQSTKIDDSAVEQTSVAETVFSVPTATPSEASVISTEAPLEALETRSEPEVQSLLTVLQGWLTAINRQRANKRGRANV